MPVSVIYLLVMLAIICIWFILLKRPIWESLGVSFIALVAITNSWGNLWNSSYFAVNCKYCLIFWERYDNLTML